MVGLSHGVLVVVSNTSPEWSGLPSSVGDRTAPRLWSDLVEAYRDGCCLRLTEEANSEGLQVRPQVAGRPTGVTAWASVERAPIPTVSVYQAVAPYADERVAQMSSRSSSAHLAEASANHSLRVHAVAVL